MSEFFDFHTHLDFYTDQELCSVSEKIIEYNIRIFSASVNIDSFERNLKIKDLILKDALGKGMSSSDAEKLVTVTFGVHPSYAQKLPVKESEALNLLQPFYEKSSFISEVGLDFFWEKECPKKVQVMHLLIALEFANKNGKVVVLHTKGAEKEIYEILKDFPNVRPVIHWFDGPVEIYKKFLEKGYPQTFGCELKYTETIKEFLRMTPDNLVLPETDNPTGEPWLGGTDSSPFLIKRIYEDIGSIQKWTPEKTSRVLEENLKSIIDY